MKGILRKTPKTKYHSADEDSESFHTIFDEDLGVRDPYTYEIHHDDDKMDNYDRTPDDNVNVFGTKTIKKTGEMQPINQKFRSLPKTQQE